MRSSGDSMWLLYSLVLVLVPPSVGYSLDVEHSLEFSGPSSSWFGYSVLLHRSGRQTWLVAGAPVANGSSSLPVRSPGGVYRCNITPEPRTCKHMHTEVSSCGKTCEGESDHQWLGVSLSRQPGEEGGRVLACAHRWKNVFYSTKDSQSNKLPNGVCFSFSSDLETSQPYIPCYIDHQRKFGENYASCQAGISSSMTEDLVIMGAPGTSYWTGSVIVYNTSSRQISAYGNDETGAVNFGSYLGYSVGAGHFLSPSSVEVVGGAPQYNQKGKVFIFTVDNSRLRIVFELPGKEFGSYFGSSVTVVDLNADGLSDLLIGAPMATSNTREEGKVHVYINEGQAKLVEAEFHLSGSSAYAARFGQSIANLGDMDDDGYPDVAVGAPQEDDLRGAVYIYNGRKEGISPTPSQRITGSSLGRDLMMFGQSLSSGVDIDNNNYKDVAVGAFLSDSAVILRARPVIQVKASLTLPEQIDQKAALCHDRGTPAVCINVTICFNATSKHFKGLIELQYNLTSDLIHKSSFPHRFYFHGNGSLNSTKGEVRTRHGRLTCKTHTAYQRKDVKDIYTPVQFEVSYGLKETKTPKHPSKAFPPLKPILQHSPGQRHTFINQTRFARSCSQVNCSTNMQLSSHVVLPDQQDFVALGSAQTIILKTSLLNSGDDAFLPRLTLRFPDNIHYVKVLQNQDNLISCDVMKEDNSTDVSLSCMVSSLVLPAGSQMNISFLFDVNHNSTPGDVLIQMNTSSDNYEVEKYLHDNAMSLVFPLKYGVSVNIHGFVSPTSFLFGDEDTIPAECYSEKLNYTFKVLNSGPSRSVDTVIDIRLPKILSPHQHKLQKLISLKSSHGECSISSKTISVFEDCDVPQASSIQKLISFFSPTSTRILFCGHGDELCEHLICRLGSLDVGRDATILLEVNLNPAVLLQEPGRHGIMMLESTAVMSSPREDPHTVLMQGLPFTQVSVEAVFTQKLTTVVQIFIIVVSLVLGLTILAALIWCLWKAGFFKRNFQKKEEEEFNRDSWDYVPKPKKRESNA
ncbi:Integrin alpha-4 [Oryzias melastigma]|uniref:Integrin alpha-4 n=1 Tax=Oryzias melastigma TaxID=30732 RepID=A0A834FGN9_ORYME|nr:Integrin alpha-4 [Oryzias melastigma]